MTRGSGINCARCGERSYERLRSHGFCWNCNFSYDVEVEEENSLIWAIKEVAKDAIGKLKGMEVAYAS